MVGLHFSCCSPLTDLNGSSRSQGCTLRCPKWYLSVITISLVYLGHLLIQGSHCQHRQPKRKRLCRPFIYTPRKVRVFWVLGTVQKSNELRTDVCVGVSVDLVLLEVIVEIGQTI